MPRRIQAKNIQATKEPPDRFESGLSITLLPCENGSWWGVRVSHLRERLLVAGEGFEPSTFGL